VGRTVTPVGKPDAGNQHVRFDERGRENGAGSSEHRHRARPRLYQFMASSASPMKLLRARRPSRARSPRANISSDPRCSLIFVHDVLEAQQKAIDRNPLMPFYNLNIDAGALWARRKIDSLLRSEQGQRLRLGYFGPIISHVPISGASRMHGVRGGRGLAPRDKMRWHSRITQGAPLHR
jgi:hypothetical protein